MRGLDPVLEMGFNIGCFCHLIISIAVIRFSLIKATLGCYYRFDATSDPSFVLFIISCNVSEVFVAHIWPLPNRNVGSILPEVLLLHAVAR